MSQENQDELIIGEIKALLVKMHKGESLIVTLNAIMDIINGIKYIEERKFIYLLQEIYQDRLSTSSLKEEDKNFMKGYNESADENNFAVKLAIDIITRKRK